jgi:AraC-like DNA-binding protein
MNKNDETLFRRAEKIILSHKLYLRDDMSRELLDRYVHIPKNKLAPIFKEYTGMGFPRFINDLRLEYAATLLKEKPNFTIESIAGECGIPVTQTFYRLFQEKFGMTPTQYRTAR